tara:strand:+ start:101 stop:1039 length:939 start_codon:yes stop_codon:yes gene_type:complete
VAFSGTSTFEKTFSIDEVITEAFERLGFFDYSGNDLRSARRSLNILFQDWQNRGVHFWEISEHCFTLNTSQPTYTIYRSPSDGNGDGIDTTLTAGISATDLTIPVASVAQMPDSGKIRINSEVIRYSSISSLNLIVSSTADRGIDDTTAASHSSADAVVNFVDMCSDVLEASYRTTANVDTPLSKINRSQYSAFSNKTSEGQPSQYWVQRFIDKVTVTLYLTPGSSQNNNFMHFYYLQRIQDAGKYTNIADVVNRFVPAMCAGLSYYISQKKAPQRTQEMKLLYEDELTRALQEDGSPASVYISPKTYYPEI